MFCSNCGTAVPTEAAFCGNCGHQVAGRPNGVHHHNVSSDSASNAAYQPRMNNNPCQYQAQNAAQGYHSHQQGNAYVPRQGYNSSPVPYSNYSGIMIWILNICTFGIFGIYTIYKMSKELEQMSNGMEFQAPSTATYILLSILTGTLYAYYIGYKVANASANIGRRYGAYVTGDGGNVILWGLLGAFTFSITHIMAWNILANNMNALAPSYNRVAFGC